MSERSAKDMTSVSTMVKDIIKIHVTSSKSFRVGKKMPEKHGLLLVTLDNPATKHDILKGARELRHSDMYSNVYITPDLTQKEREAGRKLREALASQQRAGETNLIIRGGRIQELSLATTDSVHRGPGSHSERGPATQPAVSPAVQADAPAVPVSGSRVKHMLPALAD